MKLLQALAIMLLHASAIQSAEPVASGAVPEIAQVSQKFSSCRTFTCEGSEVIRCKTAQPYEYTIQFKMWIAKPSSLRIDWCIRQGEDRLYTNSVVVAGRRGVRSFGDDTPSIQIGSIGTALLELLPELHGAINVAGLMLNQNDNLLYSVRLKGVEPADDPLMMRVTLASPMGAGSGRYLCVTRDAFAPVYIVSPAVMNVHPTLISALWHDTDASGKCVTTERLMSVTERLGETRTQFASVVFDEEIDPGIFTVGKSGTK